MIGIMPPAGSAEPPSRHPYSAGSPLCLHNRGRQATERALRGCPAGCDRSARRARTPARRVAAAPGSWPEFPAVGIQGCHGWHERLLACAVVGIVACGALRRPQTCARAVTLPGVVRYAARPAWPVKATTGRIGRSTTHSVDRPPGPRISWTGRLGPRHLTRTRVGRGRRGE
jgi:hypothetical protein